MNPDEIASAPQPESFGEECYRLRDGLLNYEKQVKELETHQALNTGEPFTIRQDEMHANLRLAYRHIEDARMRLGKAIQAFDGGKSAYPR